MEPLPPATIAGLTPPDVDVRFYDDRMELIPYDEPTDLVAISVETYTAKRAYQIASEYRRRGVPVVMGGFHPTLCPDEVTEYAEAIVVGEAEAVWPQLVDDFRHGRMERVYRVDVAAVLEGAAAGSPHLPRQALSGRSASSKPGAAVTSGVISAPSRRCSARRRRAGRSTRSFPRSRPSATRRSCSSSWTTTSRPISRRRRSSCEALAPLGIRWVSQSSINAAHDEEFLSLLAQSGCQGVLIGFESLDPAALAAMNKSFNAMRGGYEVALANLRRHRLRLYGTFIFGYDADTPDSFRRSVEFAEAHRLLHRRVQPPDAVPGHAAVREARRREPAALRALVARRPLSVQHGAVSTGVDERRHAAAPLSRGAAVVLRLAEHRAPRARRREPFRLLHVPEFLSDQRHAARGHEPPRRLSAGRRSMGRTRCCARTEHGRRLARTPLRRPARLGGRRRGGPAPASRARAAGRRRADVRA